MVRRLAGSRSKRSKFWSMHGVVKGTAFESGFEKRFLEQCYLQGIRVERCKVRVPYKDADGKWHHYEPDFYWPDFDYVIEIKGSWAFRTNHANVREKYHAAAEHFKGRYTMFTEKELKTGFVAKLHAQLHQEKIS